MPNDPPARANATIDSSEPVATTELFRLLVESVTDYAIFMLDPTGVVTTWNPGAQRFNGYEAREIIGKHFSVFYPETDVRGGKCEHELAVAVEAGRFEEEGWRVRKDGSQFWASVVISAVHDAAGRLVGFAKVTRDLTERKRAEEQRRNDEERMRLLVDSVKDYAIFILDPNGNVATWNAGAERIKGYRAEEIIGSHFSKFYPEEEVRAGKCKLELEVAERDGRFEDEGWRVRKDGSRFWANVVVSAIRNRAGKLVGFSKVTRDLSDRKRAEDDRAARLAAEEANRTKDEFLAMLGHELRNPLAPIVSALQLLKLRGDTRSVREHQIIERQVKQMVRLVDDLLDVSRVARGKIELKTKSMDLRDALAKAVEIAIPLFERKAQSFEVDVPQRPLIVEGDETRLVQVFANVLNNASKYTPDGGWIKLRVVQSDDSLSVEVHDNGIGIESPLLPRLFDLFVQGYQDVDRAGGGLGIGLTLVRALVKLHRGTVTATSAGNGKGSTFVVRLPASSVQRVPEEPVSTVSTVSTAPGRRRVLVVDDNEDAAAMLAEMLGLVGLQVETAPDGPTALAALAALEPDVAVLDIGLPGMDGYELARRIRETPRGRDIRLIALSGYCQPADRLRSEDAGFDVHLVKPVDVKKLLAHMTPPATE